jgi:hypothetical protein
VVVYVVNKFIFELEDVLEQKNVSLIVSDNAENGLQKMVMTQIWVQDQ